MNVAQPFRQIHLDFHTSDQIAAVGAAFDPERFAATLVRARVNSINLFARCHHGWIYFDTRRFPERRHPTMQRSLLREQIDACHACGIRTPIYVSVQWDDFTARQHPEWLALTSDGRIANIYGRPGTPPYEAGFYRALCVNSPYLDFLKAHVEEIFEMLPVDGLWFDIVTPVDDSSIWTRTAMLEEGLDPVDPAQRRAYAQTVIDQFKRDMADFVRRLDPACSIFFNSGHINPHVRPTLDAYTHLEIESLPGGEWGYAHFPLTARYTRTLGKEWLGMTGKFHTQWGDFHSFKNRAALEFECFQMLALGGKCCIGDQLHPSGAICETTYDLIGHVYRQVEAKEPWCRDARPVVEMALLSSGEFTDERTPPADVGAMRMLQESGFQFDVIDTSADLTRYRLLILPDTVRIAAAFAAQLRDYLAQGGAILAAFEAALDPDGRVFVLPGCDARYLGEAPYAPDFIVPRGAIGAGLPETEHVMYRRAIHIEAGEHAETLARATLPYFNRTWRHYCSHRHTPSAGVEGYPVILRQNNVIYFAHPIFSQYYDNGPRWCKTLVCNAIDMLLPARLVRHNGPGTLIVTINEQQNHSRWIVHLLHYIPIRASHTLDLIEDVIPLFDVTLTLRVPADVVRASCEPEGQSLDFEQTGHTVRLSVPRIEGHQMVALTFGVPAGA